VDMGDPDRRFGRPDPSPRTHVKERRATEEDVDKNFEVDQAEVKDPQILNAADSESLGSRS